MPTLRQKILAKKLAESQIEQKPVSLKQLGMESGYSEVSSLQGERSLLRDGTKQALKEYLEPIQDKIEETRNKAIESIFAYLESPEFNQLPLEIRFQFTLQTLRDYDKMFRLDNDLATSNENINEKIQIINYQDYDPII